MIEKFTKILHDSDDLIEIRCFPQTRNSPQKAEQFWMFAGDVGDTNQKLLELNSRGMNIFMGVLPRTSSGGGSDDDALSGNVIWADLDNNVSPTKALRRIKHLNLPEPSMVLNSGHGTHLYWKLQKKRFPSELSVAVYSLALYLKGDSAVFNPSRVMRIPGFNNTKNTEDLKKCEIVQYNPQNVYSYSEIASIFPQRSPQEARESFKSELGVDVAPQREETLRTALLYLKNVPPVREGEGRNNKAHELAKRLRDKGLSQNEVFVALRDGWNNRCSPPMDLLEISTCVRTGFKYAKKEQGCEPFTDQTKPERVRGRKRKKRKKKEPKEENKAESFTERAMGRYREQVEGKLNVIPLPWAMLGDAPILYPRKVGIITGNPGEGKTFLAMTLCDIVVSAGHKAKYLPLEDDLPYYLQRGAAISAKTWEATKRLEEIPKRKRQRYLDRLEKKYSEHFERWGEIVEENPTMCEDGEIRAIDSEWVLEWAEEQCENGVRFLVIDSLAQIEFDGREEWKAQATFWRKLLGIANRSNATIFLIIHLSKSSQNDFSSIYSAEASKRFGDLTFSMLGLQHVSGKEAREVEGTDGYLSQEKINRIIHVMKCREGSMSKKPIGFFFGKNGPSFEEKGEVL